MTKTACKVLPSLCVPRPQQVISNPSFETLDSNGNLTSWVLASNAEAPSVVSNAAVAFDGSNYVLV